MKAEEVKKMGPKAAGFLAMSYARENFIAKYYLQCILDYSLVDGNTLPRVRLPRRSPSGTGECPFSTCEKQDASTGMNSICLINSINTLRTTMVVRI